MMGFYFSCNARIPPSNILFSKRIMAAPVCFVILDRAWELYYFNTLFFGEYKVDAK